MRWVWMAVLALCVAILQISLFGSLRIGMIVPSLVLVFLVQVAIWRTASETLLFAVLAGLIVDVVGGAGFGLAVSSLVLISLLLVAARQRGIDGRSWPLRLGLTAAASLAWGLLHVGAIDAALLLSWTAWSIIAGEVVVNTLMGLVPLRRVIGGTHTV